jgi:hypothetical protein
VRRRTGREGGGNFAAAKESASRILAKKQRPPRGGLLITQNFDWRYSSSYSSYLSPGGSGCGLSATRSLIETGFEIRAARSPTRIERIWQDTGAVIWALLLSSMLRAEASTAAPEIAMAALKAKSAIFLAFMMFVLCLSGG